MEAEPGHGVLECPACVHQYELWSAIIEGAGEARYGYRVFSALALEQYIKDFQPDLSELSVNEWEDLQTVRRMISRIEEHRQFENWEQSRKANTQNA
jgi:hypothetical protein